MLRFACGGTRVSVVVLLALFIVISSACDQSSSNTAQNTAPKKPQLRFVVVTSGQVSDPFWSVVKHGVDDAAKKMDVAVTYQAPGTFSVVAMSQLIDAAVATRPDGLVVSIPDCNGLSPAIKRAQLVGIPVIAMNSGNDCASKLGLVNQVGQSGYQMGLAGGQRLVAAGAKHVLCVNQKVGNFDLDERCRGINDALTQAGGQSEVLAIDLSLPSVAQQKIEERLAHDPSINAIMTLNPTSASLVIPSLRVSRTSQLLLATFDAPATVTQAIRQGYILFAIDQKQYVQGYLPIQLLTIYRKKANAASVAVNTADPGFITKENLASIQ